MTNLNYIAARDTTGAQRWRKKDQWRLEPATFLLSPDWVTRRAYQPRHEASLSKEWKLRRFDLYPDS